MVTRDVPNRLYTILNSSDSDPFKGWITSSKGCTRVVVDEVLKKKVVSLDNTDGASATIVKEFRLDDLSAAPRLPCLSLLVRTIPKVPFTCDIEMTIQPIEEPKEQTTKKFTLTTDKRQIDKHSLKQEQVTHGWNCVVFQLAEICSTFYQSLYVATTKIKFKSGCRLYRVYFSDRLYHNEELPEGYRLALYDSTEICTVAEESTS